MKETKTLQMKSEKAGKQGRVGTNRARSRKEEWQSSEVKKTRVGRTEARRLEDLDQEPRAVR